MTKKNINYCGFRNRSSLFLELMEWLNLQKIKIKAISIKSVIFFMKWQEKKNWLQKHCFLSIKKKSFTDEIMNISLKK